MSPITTSRPTRAVTPLACAIAALVAAPAAGLAQDNTAPRDIEQIIVLGTTDGNFNVSLTDELIENKQMTDLEDMFRHEPSITVGGSIPIAQKIYVRGLEDTLLNVTIDGATQAGYLYHHQGRINVEPELIKEVSIDAGAGRATSGPGALGGAIHFVTKDAFDLLEDGQDFGGLLKAGYHSVNEGTKTHASVFGRLSDDIGFLASYTDYSADDFEDGNGVEQPESAIDQQSLMLKLNGEIDEAHSFSVSYEERDDSEIRFSRVNMINLFHPVYLSDPVPHETNRESLIASYRFSTGNPMVNFTATVYDNDAWMTKIGDQYVVWPPGSGTYMDYYDGAKHGGGVESTGLSLQNLSEFGDATLTYGLETRDDTTYLINGVVPGFENETTDVMALYAQADVELGSSMTLSAGARYDDYDYTDNRGMNFTDSGFSPNATLSFHASDQLTFHVGVAEAFKGVTSPEVFFLEFPPLPPSGTTGTNYTGADYMAGDFLVGAVAPEESQNVEIGFSFEGENFAASGEIFEQTIDNARITQNPATQVSFKDEFRTDGYAFRVGYFQQNLSLNLGVAESEPTLGGLPLGSGDMGLGTTYGRTWTASAEYRLSSADIAVGWNLRAVEQLEFVRAGQDTQPGYNVHDIYVGWDASNTVRLNLAIANLTDKFYYDQGSFYTTGIGGTIFGRPEPGRNLKLSATISF